jgi:predicted transcriptional regulator YdeE
LSTIIQTRLVWKNTFQVVGEKIRFDPSGGIPPSENEISRLWPRFNDRVGEIGHVVGGAYGLCLFGSDCVPGGPFDYMAAVGVSRVDRVPEGMTAESFPRGLYCVVTPQGVKDEKGKAFP